MLVPTDRPTSDTDRPREFAGRHQLIDRRRREPRHRYYFRKFHQAHCRPPCSPRSASSRGVQGRGQSGRTRLRADPVGAGGIEHHGAPDGVRSGTAADSLHGVSTTAVRTDEDAAAARRGRETQQESVMGGCRYASLERCGLARPARRSRETRGAPGATRAGRVRCKSSIRFLSPSREAGIRSTGPSRPSLRVVAPRPPVLDVAGVKTQAPLAVGGSSREERRRGHRGRDRPHRAGPRRFIRKGPAREPSPVQQALKQLRRQGRPRQAAPDPTPEGSRRGKKAAPSRTCSTARGSGTGTNGSSRRGAGASDRDSPGWVHPRTRGRTSATVASPPTVEGPSPRTRGDPGHGPRGARERRAIPVLPPNRFIDEAMPRATQAGPARPVVRGFDGEPAPGTRPTIKGGSAKSAAAGRRR